MSVFVATYHGDLDMEPESFHTLEEALERLANMWGQKSTTLGWGANEVFYLSPDPEDDRVLIWEVNPPWMRVVWHFSGWHWSSDCSDQPGGPLEQGKLPGHDRSLYELAMVGY